MVEFTVSEVEFEKYLELIKDRMSEAVRRLAFTLWVDIHENSPVDSGRYRDSNRIAIGVLDDSIHPPRKKGDTYGPEFRDSITQEELDRFEDVMEAYVVPGEVWISNSVPYAEQIENGRSAMTPDGVYGPAESLLAARAEEIARGFR